LVYEYILTLLSCYLEGAQNPYAVHLKLPQF